MKLNLILLRDVSMALVSMVAPSVVLAAGLPASTAPTLKPSHQFASYLPSLNDLKHGHVVVQAGGFIASQGMSQDINIQGAIGNQYDFSNKSSGSGNGLVGLGYYVNGFTKERYALSYGINAFYLANTAVSGNITQEHTFTNLSYQYNIQHIPVYLDAKTLINTNNDKYKVTLDAGLGPNFMQTSHYNETQLTSYSLPDAAFGHYNNVAFTATLGIGLRFTNLFKKVPLECGYRFFYLGQGQLAANTNQLLNTLKTGNTFANALLCSITL